MAEKLDTITDYVQDFAADDSEMSNGVMGKRLREMSMDSLMEWWDDLDINNMNCRTEWLMRLAAALRVELGAKGFEDFMEKFGSSIRQSPRRFTVK